VVLRGRLEVLIDVSKDGVEDGLGVEHVSLGQLFVGKLHHFAADVDDVSPLFGLSIACCFIHLIE